MSELSRHLRDRVGRQRAVRSDGSTESDVEEIIASGRFDTRHYCEQLGRDLAQRDAIDHYLARGERDGLAPNESFDPAFYRAVNRDLADSDDGPFVHYLRHGIAQRRYPNRSAMEADAQALIDAELFDGAYYRRSHPRVDFSTTTPLEHYLMVGHRRHFQPTPWFDSKFYVANYRDVDESSLLPVLHYHRIGRAQGRAANYASVRDVVEALTASNLFDRRWYRAANRLRKKAVPDPELHYVLHGVRESLNPSAEFSTEYYLRRYPDIAAAGVNPLHHFLLYGKDEGRSPRAPGFRSVFAKGRAAYSTRKPNLLVVLHEGSRTGAPLLGLALIQELTERYNVFTWVGRHGLLDPDLEDASVFVAFDALHDVDCEFVLRELTSEFTLDGAIANSVETAWSHHGLLAADIPSVGLIHEFAEYSRPVGKVTNALEWLDRCVFPAELVKASALQEARSICIAEPDNVVVRPQGFLPARLWSSSFAAPGSDDDAKAFESFSALLAGRKMVLGAGAVHIRKGVDLFIETARQVLESGRTDVHFVWIGDGWAPDADMAYSVWVDDMIDRAGVRGHVTFMGAQSTLSPAFAAADAFFLSSRLDPFPNVAIDAIAADVPLVCFDQTTGIAEFVRTNDVGARVVPYLDCRSAAETLVELLDEAAPVDNTALLEGALGFHDYVDFIEEQLVAARAAVERRREHVADLAAFGTFDARFHRGGGQVVGDRAVLRDYVAQSTKGIHRAAPRAGFNDVEYLHRVPVHGSEDGPALLAASRRGEVSTHEVIEVGARTNTVDGRADADDLRAALHVHLYYIDSLPELVAGLTDARFAGDLYVSSTDARQAAAIERELLGLADCRVDVRVVPNAGRDIGPFITAFGSDLLSGSYDVIGHVHGKKSVDLADGEAWRRFLWTSLFAGDGVWPATRQVFRERPDLGLLFPEDSHTVGWTRNRPYGRELLQRLGLGDDLPDVPVFPLGTMFWSRPQALKVLLESELAWSDYPPEPVPYDGSLLHAIERLLPHLCETAGYRWATVRAEGAAR